MTRSVCLACLTTLLTTTAISGCRDKPHPTPAPAAKASATATSDARAAFYRNGVVTLPFGVELPSPLGTTVEEGAEADTWIVENASWSIAVSRAAPTAPKTAEAARALERDKDPARGEPATWKSTKLTDGYVVTYDIDSQLDHTYFGEVRRDFGDVAVTCAVAAGWKSGTAKESVAKKRDAGVDACKELRRKR